MANNQDFAMVFGSLIVNNETVHGLNRFLKATADTAELDTDFIGLHF